MRVDLHELSPDGVHVLAGSYILHAGEIRPVPSQVPGSLTLLNNVLASVTIPVHGGDNITPLTDPKGWLEGLHTRLRSPYLQASKAVA
jgi:hypothetical protein